MIKEIEKHYRKNNHILKKKITRSVGGWWNAEDVVQDTYLRAIENKDAFSSSELTLDEWINRLLNNSLRSFRRNNRIIRQAVELKENDIILEAEADNPIDNITEEEIKEDISRFNNPKKEILKLFFLKNYKPKDINDIVDASPGAIRNIIWRYRDELKRRFV